MRFFMFLLGTLGFSFLHAQQTFSDPQQFLTYELYDEYYRLLPGNPDEVLGVQLSGLRLNDMVRKGIIRRGDMRGLALPIGIHLNTRPVSFTRGMQMMWQAKADFAARRELELPAEVKAVSRRARARLEKSNRYMSLRMYRDSVITPAITQVQTLHKRLRLYHKRRDTQEFMDRFIEQFAPNMLLGFNLQELLPPRVGLRNEWINPLFKAYYYDRLLQEGGLAFVEGFPAQHDTQLSFGPFQMTPIALEEIQEKIRSVPAARGFRTMVDLVTAKDHALAAAIYAYHNWEKLAFFLRDYGGLTHVNRYFRDSSGPTEKRRMLRILMAGTTAAMHHNSPVTRNAFQAYAKRHTDLGRMYRSYISWGRENEILNSGLNRLDQINKYYRSSAEAYVLMKSYHRLIKNS